MVARRFDVYLVTLEKTRPCLVISPDEMNRHVRTVIVAPLTSRGQPYPTRVTCKFQGTEGQVVLDQIRAVDKARLVKKLGRVSEPVSDRVLDGLAELFAR